MNEDMTFLYEIFHMIDKSRSLSVATLVVDEEENRLLVELNSEEKYELVIRAVDFRF